MKILVLSQYFWPENFRINELTKELNNSKKIEVDVLTCIPSYPHKEIFKGKRLNDFGNVKVHRVSVFLRNKTLLSKILNYITFVISASIYLLLKNKKKYDAIFVFQVSPVFSAIPAILYSKFNETKIYLWVLDLWPDSISIFGYKSKFLFFLIKKISEYVYSNSNILLGQSKSITKILKKKYKKKTYYFPNWSEDIIEKKISKSLELCINKKIDKYKISIFFGGNIGKAQDFKNILKAINKINKKTNNFNWYIFGEGSEKEKIIQYIDDNNINNIFLFKSVSQQNLMYIVKKFADFVLVCLSKNKTLKWTVPGKVQFYFQCKKPIIGMLSGEAKKLIKNSNSGYVVNSGDYIAFSNLLKVILKNKNKNLWKKKGMNGYNFANKYFNKKIIVKELVKKIVD